jgi:hypothetical protein
MIHLQNGIVVLAEKELLTVDIHSRLTPLAERCLSAKDAFPVVSLPQVFQSSQQRCLPEHLDPLSKCI